MSRPTAAELADECRAVDFDVREATEENMHVYVVFETGEICVTKCGPRGWLYGERSLLCESPPIVEDPVRIGMPRKFNGHRCTVLRTELEARQLQDRIRALNVR